MHVLCSGIHLQPLVLRDCAAPHNGHVSFLTNWHILHSNVADKIFPLPIPPHQLVRAAVRIDETDHLR